MPQEIDWAQFAGYPHPITEGPCPLCAEADWDAKEKFRQDYESLRAELDETRARLEAAWAERDKALRIVISLLGGAE